MQKHAKMNVVEVTEGGGPDVLVLSQSEIPEPAADEVLIKVTAAGVNGPDLMQRRGLYPAPAGASHLLGLEVSGEIVGTGTGVSGWKTGDRVAALSNGGGYADYCVADARHCMPIPDGVSEQDAAGFPETFFTVWSNLFMEGGLKSGDLLLVHGGAGGIGTTAIQIAKALGVRIIATDTPADRCQTCIDLGADRAVDYRNEDFVEIVRKEGGANMILDIVGGPYVERNIKAAAPGARIVQLAFALGSKIEINLMPIMLKRITYTGSTLRTRPDQFKAEIAKQLIAKVWPHIANGNIKPVTSRVFPLSEAAAAHTLMESASHSGKILLCP